LTIHSLYALAFRHFRPAQPLRKFTLWGWITRPSRESCARFHSEPRLLSAREMLRLFPGASLLRERWLGLPKSLIAVRCSIH
jgi:hypothetical protein